MFTGDNDSSVTKRLLVGQPYGPHFYVKKVECINHLLRNMDGHLRLLMKNCTYSVNDREHLKKNVQRFRQAVYGAINYWKEQDILSFPMKVKKIKYDLINTASHIFDHHVNCR